MLFTFPSRYWYAIGLTRVFSLAGWARRIRAGLHVSRVTQDTTDWHVRTSKGLSPAMAGLSRPFLLSHTMTLCGPTTPQRRRHNCGLGSSPVARHYWGNHCYFLLLEVLRCFSSLRSPLYQCTDNSPSDYWVVPFGNRGIKGHLHLPRAYRSLSRPSSPPRAKASTRRPNFLSPFSSYFQL